MIVAAGVEQGDAILDLVRELRRRETQRPVLVIGGPPSSEFAIAAFRVGAADVLSQECTAAEAAAALDRIAGKPAGKRAPANGRIAGNSEATRRTLATIEKASATDLNVLITGETGTGKELVAERIHALSRRSGHPFVAINCAAVPADLLESELFGCERGAFTGAHAARDGKLPLARGGTVFLDEIGDMDLFSQAKILRALENRRVQRLGGQRDILLDIRVVAATNQNLEELAAQGRFRLDLFYRLNVIRIHLAPLRERAGDIPTLVEQMLADLNASSERAPVSMDHALAERLAGYPWPGNIRELRNAVESAFAFSSSSSITEADLPLHIGACLAAEPEASETERDRVLHALSSADWNKSEAAKILHWSRMTLYRKMSRYGIDSAKSCNMGRSAVNG